MTLKKVESIAVKTQHGDCEIQLLYGDITKLPLEDKVDFILVSAFPGDYTAVPGTLIGALFHDLGVSVETLAYNREMDLRKHFHCWMSRQLPESIPFNRLVCFERSLKVDVGDIMEQIRTMFRALTPLFNNQPSTVISPLLGTGNQGHSQAKIMQTMLDAAYHWITAGLPLKCFKLVVYCRNPNQMDERERGLVGLFRHYRDSVTMKSFEGQRKAGGGIKYEIYLSYSTEDQEWAEHVQSSMGDVDQTKVFNKRQVIKKDSVFQEHIFKIMIQCSRIIAILTPEYMNSADCIEQYNIAMCCNRHTVVNIIAPLYIRTISSMPTYMSLVQYVDCRERKEGEDSKLKIKDACDNLIKSIQEHNIEYDVFISYAHKNPTEAEQFRKTLETEYPNLKVFFDRSELKTGNLWQKTLYEALDHSRCILTLISPSYLSSAVCQEEYSIALARFIKTGGDVQLIPVCIEDIPDVPVYTPHVKMIDGRNNLTPTIACVCKAIDNWLSSGRVDEFVLNKPETNLSLGSILQTRRQNHTGEKYSLESKQLTPLNFKDDGLKKVPPFSIVMSYAQCDLSNAIFLSYLITQKLPSVNILLRSSSTKDRFDDLDKANKIVIFLSSDYLSSVTLIEELHLALVRHRNSKTGSLIYTVITRPLLDNPTFIHLLPCFSSCCDEVWETTTSKTYPKDVSVVVKSVPGYEGSYFIGIKEVLVLNQIMWDILADACQTDITDTRNTVIENIVKLDMINKRCDITQTVPLSQCLKAESLNIDNGEKTELNDLEQANNHVINDSTSDQETQPTVINSDNENRITAEPSDMENEKRTHVRFTEPKISPRKNSKSSFCTLL